MVLFDWLLILIQQWSVHRPVNAIQANTDSVYIPLPIRLSHVYSATLFIGSGIETPMYPIFKPSIGTDHWMYRSNVALSEGELTTPAILILCD